MHAENNIDERLPHQISEKANNIAYSKATKDFLSAFYLFITAGLFISLAFFFYITVTTEPVARGLLFNIMVCLAIWMAFEVKTVTDKMFAVLLPVAIFIASGFEHCIANIFMVPTGILIQHFAPAEFWIAIAQNPSTFADISTSDFIFNNLIPVTIGNIIGGGVIVGLMYWIIYLRPIQKNKTIL